MTNIEVIENQPITRQDLIDADVDELEIENLIGEGWTLVQIYLDKVDKGVIDPSTGCCMCGSMCADHGLGSGHAPVDEGWYFVDQLRAR